MNSAVPIVTGSLLLLYAIFVADCAPVDPPGASDTSAVYLFVWAGDADEDDSDFLAVIDARRMEPTYGDVIATLPVGLRATMPHHTEYEYPPDRMLFANGWVAGRTFLFDLRDPLNPKLAAQFTNAEEYTFPHSYARLPNGHVLATFQTRGDRYGPAGGLVELDSQGRPVRSASAATAELDRTLIWPYSLVVHPTLGIAVSTNAEMGMPPWGDWDSYHHTYHVQIWSTDELRLVSTVPLPAVGDGNHHIDPAEPRLLEDGTVYVSTFSCGLYRIDRLESENPQAAFVHAFPGGTSFETMCAVPVVVGRYWIQTVTALPGLIVLDVSDPGHPVEVSRLVLDERYPTPHWLAADRGSGRLVVTGDHASWILIADLDMETGTLTVDPSFRDDTTSYPGIDFDRVRWPHGETGGAVVHGALFGR